MLDKGDNFELDEAVEWLTFSFLSEMSGVRFSTWKLTNLRETLWISSVPPDKLHVSILKQAKTTSFPFFQIYYSLSSYLTQHSECHWKSAWNKAINQ